MAAVPLRSADADVIQRQPSLLSCCRSVYHGADTKRARQTIPAALYSVARRKLDMVNAAREIASLRIPPSNHLETLKGNLKGWHSIRINDQYRVIFQFSNGNATNVTIVDYH